MLNLNPGIVIKHLTFPNPSALVFIISKEKQFVLLTSKFKVMIQIKSNCQFTSQKIISLMVAYCNSKVIPKFFAHLRNFFTYFFTLCVIKVYDKQIFYIIDNSLNPSMCLYISSVDIMLPLTPGPYPANRKVRKILGIGTKFLIFR